MAKLVDSELHRTDCPVQSIQATADVLANPDGPRCEATEVFCGRSERVAKAAGAEHTRSAVHQPWGVGTKACGQPRLTKPRGARQQERAAGDCAHRGENQKANHGVSR